MDTITTLPARPTRDELIELSRDILADKVFMSYQLPPHDTDLIANIFMPLLFLTEEQRTALLDTGASCFYEYLSEAGSRAINGYPMFMSFRYLLPAELEIVRTMVRTLYEAQNTAMATLA